MSTWYMGVVVPAVVIVPLGMALCRVKSWQQQERLVFAYLLLSAGFNLLAKLLAGRQINNMPALHLYTILEFGLLSRILISFFESGRVRRQLYTLLLLFPLFAVGYIRYSDSLYAYNVLPRFLASILLVLFCLLFLLRDLSDLSREQPMFRFTVVIGFLLYFSGSSALFGLSELIKGNRPLNTLLWNAHATLVLVLYLVIAAAYYMLPVRK